jgi:hypothetical protein
VADGGVAPANVSYVRSGPQGQKRICVRGETNAPVGGDQVVDEDQHLELGQLVPGARVHAAPKWQERVRPRRHLHTFATYLLDFELYIYLVNEDTIHCTCTYLESRRVELVWILEVVRAVMDVPEQRHHLPPLGDKEPYNTPRNTYESELFKEKRGGQADRMRACVLHYLCTPRRPRPP